MFDICITYIRPFFLSVIGTVLRAPALSYLEMWLINQQHSLEWKVTWELLQLELQILVGFKIWSVILDTIRELYGHWGVGNIDYKRLRTTMYLSICHVPGRFIMGIVAIGIVLVAVSLTAGIYSVPVKEHSEWIKLSCDNLLDVKERVNVPIFESMPIQNGKMKLHRTSEIRTFEHRCQVAIDRVSSCYALADNERAGRYRASLDDQMKLWLEAAIKAISEDDYYIFRFIVDSVEKESVDWIFLQRRKLYCHLPVPSTRPTNLTFKYCSGPKSLICAVESVGNTPREADNGSGLSFQRVGTSIIYSKAGWSTKIDASLQGAASPRTP